MTTTTRRFSALSVFLVGLAGTFGKDVWSNVDKIFAVIQNVLFNC